MPMAVSAREVGAGRPTLLQRAGSLRPEIHSVMLTNYATPEVRRRSEQLGARRVFDKADDLDAMIQYFSHMARDAAGSREPPSVT
jgi:hypothetical protein